MKALLARCNLARIGVLGVVLGAAALAGLTGPAAAQYFPPLQFCNNGLSIHVPYVRLFPGFPAYPVPPVVPGCPSQNCLLDRQVRVLLNEAGFYDVSFFGYASTRAHARAARGDSLYQLTVHRCTQEIISAVPIGRISLR